MGFGLDWLRLSIVVYGSVVYGSCRREWKNVWYCMVWYGMEDDVQGDDETTQGK